MRLIDADALLEEIEQIMRSPWAQDGTFAERTIKRDAMCFLRDLCVRDAPTIDAEPVVHARWEEDRMDYRCTACGTSFKDEIAFAYHGECKLPGRCLECGARMDGGAE